MKNITRRTLLDLYDKFRVSTYDLQNESMAFLTKDEVDTIVLLIQDYLYLIDERDNK